MGTRRTQLHDDDRRVGCIAFPTRTGRPLHPGAERSPRSAASDTFCQLSQNPGRRSKTRSAPAWRAEAARVSSGSIG